MSRHSRVAVATTSEIAARAAAAVSAEGGNAVDCAIAASMVAINTQPGVCALAGGAYVTVWPADGDPVTIDGGVAVPGKSLSAAHHVDRGVSVHMEYGGGVETVAGCASVGVPGTLAACERASRRYGRAPWETVLAPAIRIAGNGFPLPAACRYYLEFSGEPIFRRSADGERALYDAGRLRRSGETIIVPHLADSLAAIAAEGADVFYRGALAEALVEHVRDGGGALTVEDLATYEPLERTALTTDLERWRIALNPPPAIGGAMLAAMLIICRDLLGDNGSDSLSRCLLVAQQAALAYRRQRLDWSRNVSDDALAMLELARSGGLLPAGASASTVHTSAVDASGLGCSITSSAGYGSGEMPSGTGLWLNNCLGELELNRRGLDAAPPGARLPSNMAPGVARCGPAVLAFGSPGADRITTALQQFLVYHLLAGDGLQAANDRPRLHVEAARDPIGVSLETGLELGGVDLPRFEFPPHSMYFGGVGAAHCDDDGNLSASADPRRAGGVFVTRDLAAQ